MEEENFSTLGKIEAIKKLYESTPFTPFESKSFETSGKEVIASAGKVLLEGIDFDLVYFTLKHLGYKSVIAATGELYAEMAHPEVLDIVIGISAKLDFGHIKQFWEGIVAAAKEHGYKKVGLDLVPSRNGLCISISAVGKKSLLSAKRRMPAKSMDLICVSDNLGAAFFGLNILEREKKKFEEGSQPALEDYKLLVGAYLKPELPAGVVGELEKAEICPGYGYFVTRGLADALRRLVRDSGLGAKVYVDKIPFAGKSFDLGKEMNIDPVSAAMNGGDDYRLLFTIPITKVEDFRRDFQTFDIIGHLAKPEVGAVLVTPDGVELPVKAQGWNNE